MDNFAQPSIYLGNLRIDEPVTTLTDLFVTAVCFFAYYRLRKIKPLSRMQIYLIYYFLTMGLATALGGLIGHAFLYKLSFEWKLPGWLMSMFSVALLERASILYAKPLISKKLGKFFGVLNIVELATFVILAFSTLNFFFVEAHSAYGLLIIVAGFHGFVFYKQRTKGSKLFLIAVGISAISALIFMNEWGLHPFFNHYDISHTLMAIGAFVFYKGSLQSLREHPIADTVQVTQQ